MQGRMVASNAAWMTAGRASNGEMHALTLRRSSGLCRLAHSQLRDDRFFIEGGILRFGSRGREPRLAAHACHYTPTCVQLRGSDGEPGPP